MGQFLQWPLGKPPTLVEFRQAHLAEAMRKERGRKRLRKKKAQRALRQTWVIMCLIRPLRQQVNYSEIGRQMFRVEPLPQGALPTYMNDPDVTAIVTGESE